LRNRGPRSNDDRRQSSSDKPVSLENSIVSNNPQLFYTGLSDEHPVERITVHSRETTDRDGVPQNDRHGLETAFDNGILEIIQFDFNSTQGRLNRDLPD
jgi:hypothetical protein